MSGPSPKALFSHPIIHTSPILCSGIYCLLVVAHLLNLLTPELVEGTAAFVASCQTYEGGFSSASQPYFTGSSDSDSGPPSLMSSPRPPLGEAHGGYTFCALATWVMLQPFVAEIPEAQRPSIDMHTLLRWLSHMQGAEIDLGGFKGRTNKLVDACYSWWVGASFALLEALGVGGSKETEPTPPPEQSGAENDEAVWDDVDGQRTPYRLSVLFLTSTCNDRYSSQPQGPSRVHSLRRPTSGRRITRQTTKVRPLRFSTSLNEIV
jgi:protein farnesyltransferase subunit beta